MRSQDSLGSRNPTCSNGLRAVSLAAVKDPEFPWAGRRALLPAAGSGRRARPLTHNRPKCLLEVNGEPLIVRSARILRDELGIRDIVVITGEGADQIQAALAAVSNVTFTYVHCKDSSIGLARGMLLAQEHLQEPFVTLLPDEVYVAPCHAGLPVPERSTVAVCGAIPDADPRLITRNYSIQAAGLTIKSLTEKPKAPAPGWLGCGTFGFSPAVFDRIRGASPGGSSSVELIDVLNQSARSGRDRVGLFPMRGEYVNVNTVDEWHRATDLIRAQAKPKLSVVIPALNEEDSIARVVADFAPRADEVLVVDNLSQDRTAERARAAGARVETVKVAGYGDALRYGMDHAAGDALVLVEADHSFRADDLDKLLSFLPSADMVIGTRTTRQLIEQGSNMGPLLRWGNVAVGKLIEGLWWSHEPRFTDVGCTYRALWRSTWHAMRDDATANGPAFSPEMMIEALRHHRRVVEVPVSYHARLGGDSKHSGSFVASSKTAMAMLKLIGKKRLGIGRRKEVPRGTPEPTPDSSTQPGQ